MLELVAEVLGHRSLEEPPDTLQRLFDELERHTATASGPRRDPRAFLPPVDLARSARGLFIRALLPGVPEDSLELSIEGNTLIIRGTADDFPPPGTQLLNRESSGGYFERVIVLPAEARAHALRAQLEDGVLEIVVPLTSENVRG